MKIIGRTNDGGGVLLETSIEEYTGLLSAATALVGLPTLMIEGPRLAQVAPPDHPYPSIPPPIHNDKATKRPIKTKVSKGDRHKKCEICGDPFVDNSPRNQRKICTKQKCIKERKHQWQNAYLKYKNKGKTIQAPAVRVADVNPANPMLTDEERVKAARLAGIRARMP
jgi:hypothetical protein